MPGRSLLFVVVSEALVISFTSASQWDQLRRSCTFLHEDDTIWDIGKIDKDAGLEI